MVDSAAGRRACVLVLDSFEAGCVLRAVRLAQSLAAVRDELHEPDAEPPSAYWLARADCFARVAALLEQGAQLEPPAAAGAQG